MGLEDSRRAGDLKEEPACRQLPDEDCRDKETEVAMETPAAKVASQGPSLPKNPMEANPWSDARLSSVTEIREALLPTMKSIQGIQYPMWINQEIVHRLQHSFSPRAGDVILVSHFPLRGLQRLIVALVEGQKNPWADGLLDKPYFLEGGASRRGVDDYLAMIASWPGRRCFKTHAFPQLFPCRWPIEHHCDGIPPKVVVLVADPRYALSLLWEFASTLGRGTMGMSEFIVVALELRMLYFGDYFKHAVAWAQESLERPETVRLFAAERFASHDPAEVRDACGELATFLEIPRPDEAVTQLVEATFDRPADATAALQKDACKPHEAINGGPLIELVGPRLESFQEGLMELSGQVHEIFGQLVASWVDCSHPCLARLGRVASRGAGSLLPARLARPLKGAAVHEAGQCRPCVFALRGICRNSAAMCAYCHAEGHAKTKRASRSKRAKRRTRVYTPSPEGLSS